MQLKKREHGANWLQTWVALRSATREERMATLKTKIFRALVQLTRLTTREASERAAMRQNLQKEKGHRNLAKETMAQPSTTVRFLTPNNVSVYFE